MDAILNSTFFNYLTVAVGLGFVIFIHELGHFLMAKWNDVKVEMFSIGFGPALVSYRRGLGLRLGSTGKEYEKWLSEHPESAEGSTGDTGAVGETEYSIRLIPLGGFVKMLGEGEETDRQAVKTTDPRAYPNKSIGGRMGIISAGVIMNAIFGILCFAWAYGRGGLPVVPAKIGGVVAGHPAYAAGVRPGDEVVAVDGRGNVDFLMLKRITAMSGLGEVLDLDIKRPGVDQPIRLSIEPKRQGESEMKTMGILMPTSLSLAEPPFVPPAGIPAGEFGEGLKKNAKIVAVGAEGETPAPVTSELELNQRLAALKGQNVVLETIAAGESTEKGARERVVLPAISVVDFGFVLEMGPILAIRPDSPAQAAGFKVGDTIVGVEGVEIIDPMRLPDEFYNRAGETVTVRVARSEGGKPATEVELEVVPEPQSSWVETYMSDEPMDLASLGLAYRVSSKIASVADGSPAARAGLKAGDAIREVTLTYPAMGAEKEEPVKLAVGDTANTWPAVFSRIQQLPRHEVAILVNNAKEPARMIAEPVEGWYYPMRGLMFQVENEPLPAMGFTDAVRRGLDDTYDTITSIYAMFRSLVLGLISPKALGGPIMIADLASQTARAGLVSFLQFLGMLSLNLAVINFLPIPPLDGGQMAFLLAEKVRGKPLPESALNAGTIMGLVFVLGLMAFVVFQDVMRYFV